MLMCAKFYIFEKYDKNCCDTKNMVILYDFFKNLLMNEPCLFLFPKKKRKK